MSSTHDQIVGARLSTTEPTLDSHTTDHDQNLLTGGLFTVKTGDGHVRLTLPGLIARLLTTLDLMSFPRLAAEQRGYAWRFFVRTAAKALKVSGLTVTEAGSIPTTRLEEIVHNALLEQTELGDWAVFQPELSKPGFLQVPLEAGASFKTSNYRLEDCSLLTAIIGTKGHERKFGVTRELSAEEVVYSLIEYQTGTIFGGRGNYESQFTGSRSGAASGTPFMGANVGDSLPRTFAHDVGVFLRRWEQVVDDIGLKGTIWALWREPWDGTTQLLSTKLDPAFVPMARMIRLGEPKGGRYSALWFRPSQVSRVLDHTEGGRLGDIFTPTTIDPTRGHRKVRGALEKGYDYVEVFDLLFGEEGAQRSPSVGDLMSAPPDTDDLSVVFEGLALSQGKTLGFHRREVRLPRQLVRRGLNYYQPRADALHAAMLTNTRDTKRVLRSSFGVLWKGSPKVRDNDKKKVDGISNELDLRVNQIYIEALLDASTSDQPIQDATLSYRQWLFDVTTSQIFPAAVNSVPRSLAREMEALTRAEAYLRGGLRRVLDLPRPEKQPEEGPDHV